jgi:hypothetical protein
MCDIASKVGANSWFSIVQNSVPDHSSCTYEIVLQNPTINSNLGTLEPISVDS